MIRLFFALLLLCFWPIQNQPWAIQNPGFEGIYVRRGISRLDPAGWTIYQVENERGIETTPADLTYPYRVHSGAQSLKIINPDAPIHVYVYQPVISPLQGGRARFAIYVQGWRDYDGQAEVVDGIPVSDGESYACAFVSLSPPPFSIVCNNRVNDAWYLVEEEASLPPNSRFYVGVYLQSAPARVNDFYADDATLSFLAAAPTTPSQGEGGVIEVGPAATASSEEWTAPSDVSVQATPLPLPASPTAAMAATSPVPTATLRLDVLMLTPICPCCPFCSTSTPAVYSISQEMEESPWLYLGAGVFIAIVCIIILITRAERR